MYSGMLLNLLILIVVRNHQGVDSFISTPQLKNVTVNYGEFVEFTCRFHFIDHSPHILEIYFGNSGSLIASSNQFNVLEPHEYYVNITYTTNETVGIAGILINKKTIQVMEFFRCKLIHGIESVFSSPAYIVDINYPECAQLSQSQTSTLRPIPSQTLSILTSSPTSTIPALKLCTAFELTHEKAATNIAVGVYAALVTLMLCILLPTCVHVYIKNNKSSLAKLKRSSITTNQVTRSMVQNPIYDGPVYESVQTHFDSLTAQVTAATSADNSCSKCPSLNASAPLDNATDKNRYISQPGIIEPVTNEHPELCNRECLAGASTLGSNNDSVVPQSKFSINS